MSEKRRVDVVVVGAGPAGAHVAGQLAQRGRSVALLERRPLSAGGAQWHNGVLPWQFEKAGVAPPVPDEVSPDEGVGHVVGPEGQHAFSMRGGPTVRADMAALGESLRSVACDAGVEMLDRVTAFDVEVDADGRVRAVDTGTLRLEADLFVDASGRAGVLRRHSPALAPWCPLVRGGELCSATDGELEVSDPDGARRFLESHDAEPGDTVSFMGYAGGWSMRMVRVSSDLRRAVTLVGCIANGRYGTGPSLMADFRRDLPWLGEATALWSGVIPLRRPYARFTAPGLALVGDSACQVFPAHGSGIGLGLMAGRMLVDAAADAADPGAEDVLWRYQHRFQVRHGGLLAALDAFRRMSTALGTDGVRRMITANLFDEDVARAAMDQRVGGPRPSSVPRMAWGLLSSPRLAAVMVPRMARGSLLSGMGARYPAEVDLAALGRWDARVERLLGPLPA